MKTILILGASGLLGKFVAKDLSADDKNFDVVLQRRQKNLHLHVSFDLTNQVDFFEARSACSR